jgi:hypothetical protein
MFHKTNFGMHTHILLSVLCVQQSTNGGKEEININIWEEGRKIKALTENINTNLKDRACQLSWESIWWVPTEDICNYNDIIA